MSKRLHESVSPSELRALRRFVAEAERAYRRYLEGDIQGWDAVVVTVASERQAEICKAELEERFRSGVLPRRTAAFASADPDGVRIGSGTATVRALRLVEQKVGFAGRKVLIIHSGGDSRRIPFHSQIGKVFARLPRLRDDGRPACVFDLIMQSLIGLSERFSEGVVVASGDVLLAFNPDDVHLLEPGVTGVAVPVPWRQGCNHGVYIAGGSGGPVVQFLQKPDRGKLTDAGGIDRRGRVLVDTGLLYFDTASAEALLSLPLSKAGYMDLYEDVLCSLPLHFSPDGFNDVADENRRRVRELIWKQLRGIRFQVRVPRPAYFVHLGTAAQFREAVTSDPVVPLLFGFSRRVCSYLAGEACAGGATVVGSVLEGAVEVGEGALVDGCALAGCIKVGANSVLAGVDLEGGDFEIPPGVVMHRVLVCRGDASEFAYLVYGVNDDPKLTIEAGASLFGEAITDRLRRFGVAEDEVWPHVPDGFRSLWNARLYPVLREDCGPEEILWMAGQHPPSKSELSRWRTAERISMEDSVRLVDWEAERIRSESLLRRADEVRVLSWLRGETSTFLAFSALCSETEARTAANAAERLALDSEQKQEGPEGCIRRARLWKMKADFVKLLGSGKPSAEASAYEEKAFAEVKNSIISATPVDFPLRLRMLSPGSCAVVEAPARVDFGGGWSDTPPHCLERGGVVLNAAVLLGGNKPVRATALLIDEPVVRLRSVDQHVGVEYRFAEDVISSIVPSDPFGLHK
ncbi:MAG: fucose pyrophosphorylase domain-containing protein, partial [Armatimonadota bacterium]